MKNFWEERFQKGKKVWGESPSISTLLAHQFFHSKSLAKLYIPGAGYGRNAKFFTEKGYTVYGSEIAETAFQIAKKFCPGLKIKLESVLEASYPAESFDAVYCFNVLHLFLKQERELFIQKIYHLLKDGGKAFFVVFSENEASYGKGVSVEENTFESRPGRPVHYFSGEDLKNHFKIFRLIESGLIDDAEDHGEEGPHVHLLRYIAVQKR